MKPAKPVPQIVPRGTSASGIAVHCAHLRLADVATLIPRVGDTSWKTKQGGNGAMFGGAKRRKGGTKKFMADTQGSNTAPVEFIAPGMAYPGNRLPPFSSAHSATGHAAAFPIGLPEFFIKAFSDRANNVYDPFLGSGTTLIACENLGRKCYGLEISPAYCAVILQRAKDAFPNMAIKLLE